MVMVPGDFRVFFICGLNNVADFTKPLPVAVIRHRVLTPFIAADPTDSGIDNLTLTIIVEILSPLLYYIHGYCSTYSVVLNSIYILTVLPIV